MKSLSVSTLGLALIACGGGGGGSLAETDTPERKAVSTVMLSPDVTSTLTAIQQVEAVLGSGSVDLPTTHDGTHLSVATDADVGDYFLFSIHLKEDGDRELKLTETDRQRVELKSYANSPDATYCTEGEIMGFEWSFYPGDLNLSTSFTHLMQVKGGNEHPLLTITAKRTGGVEALRINHGSNDDVLGEVDWEKINSHWVDAEMEFKCSNDGYLKLKLTDHETQKTLFNLDKANLDMWQDIDGDKLGIKLGIYRKVKDSVSDETFKAGLISLEDHVRISAVTIKTY